jgi:inhibitor of Bruton tyrosine kinase
MVPLWQYFLQDDLDAFRQFLADATFNVGTHKGLGTYASHKGGSPALPSTPPRNTFVKSRKPIENTSKAARISGRQDHRLHQVNLTRAEVNARDAYGRTILHHAAASSSANALGFVEALLQIPFIDLYLQDLESGWTPLHRALYHGHISIAQALMLRDDNDVTDYISNMAHHVAGGLIKIKDHEGNSPFEVFSLTIASRELQHSSQAIPTLSVEDANSVNSADVGADDLPDRVSRRLVQPRVNLLGDEVFAFGSNKNLNLGLGDEDDRHFPEQVTFQRPEQLLHRLYVDAQGRRSKEFGNPDLSSSQEASKVGNAWPAVVKTQRIVIQDVVMSKLHSAVITNDPEANVYVCGFGPGGRLGTGDESTRFNYVCLQTGGLSKKQVVVVALGQDHSIAVCEQGEVFTWGANKFGQLGYSLPQSSSNTKENPMQLTPRQLFGPMKKEMIVGAAASSLHSVIFTVSALYTFGKNEGQLGLMDADARSLEMQVIPRRVGVSILQSPILMVSAIDRATTILLESHEVVVLTHYGWTKVVFQLESFTNYFLQGSSATRYDPAGNFISKITSGGNNICALSKFGEVFTVDVSKKPEPLVTNQSTTNPSKARNALPPPSKLWSIRKSHMAARDLAVGQDGSIILCTVTGSVWRKEKRAKIKGASARGSASRTKDYKFARIPNINRIVAVRSNAYGAFTAVRKDSEVTRQQIIVDPQSIWDTLLRMLPFGDLAAPNNDEDSDTEHPRPRFWTPVSTTFSPVHVKQATLLSLDMEDQVRKLMLKHEPLAESQYDLWITSTTSDVRIPAHSFLVKARSRVLRHALAEFQESYYFSIPNVISIEYGPDGHIHLIFQAADFFTILNYIFYLYTDNIVDFWHHTQRRSHVAPRYRQIRTELMKIAGNLEMVCLERATRVMTEPARCLHSDMEMAFQDSNFFTDADVRIELANELEVSAHSALLSRRCPFFEGLFNGRAGGSWLSSRRGKAEEISDMIRVDLKHVEEQTFGMVLRHIYADTGEELFDTVVTSDLDEFIDVIIEVMAVSNELMLDRLTQVCQKALGQYVTTRNICQLLNAVAPCSVDEFKHAGLEYICLNLETMLEQRLLEELDNDLLVELDEMVQENQLACLPFARSGRAEADLFDQHPELAGKIAEGKQRMIDSLRIRSRYLENAERIQNAQKPRAEGSEGGSLTSASSITKQPTTGGGHSVVSSPAPKPREHSSDMLFDMEEEHSIDDLIESSFASSNVDNKHVQDEVALDSASPSSLRQYGLPQRSDIVHQLCEGPVASLSASSLREHPLSLSALTRTSGAANDTSPGAEIDHNAWRSPLAGSAKADFKDIMTQASASRTSNLTLAISHRDAQLGKASNRPSQRERKKIRHQQSQDKVSTPSDEIPPNSDPSLSSRNSKSPWQTIQKPAEQRLFPGRSSQGSVPSHPSPRPAMTMRQTLAGASTLTKEDTPAKPNPNPRSVSTPGVGQSSIPKPQIQSIRHNPAPPTVSSSPLGAYHSMADILAQQQGEKTAIKVAAAKRSLQEIQQEQEFQEWWDNEAKRVQEEEQASAAAAASGTEGGRGRGRGGRWKRNGRGGSGGAASVKEIDTRKVSADGASRSDNNNRGKSQRGGRGRGRGQRDQR